MDNILKISEYTNAYKNGINVSVITDRCLMIINSQVKTNTLGVDILSYKEQQICDEFNTLHTLYHFPFFVIKKWMEKTNSNAIDSLKEMNQYFINQYNFNVSLHYGNDTETISIIDEFGILWLFVK